MVRAIAKRFVLSLFRNAPGASLGLISLLARRSPQQASILHGLLFRTQVDRLQGFLARVDYPVELRLSKADCFAHVGGLDLDTRLVDRYFLLDASKPTVSQGAVLYERLKGHGVEITRFVDLGANFGEYSLWFAKCTTAEILAIEPSSENIAVLQGNARRNGIDLARITLRKLAVADKPGTVAITIGRSQGNSIVNVTGATEAVPSDSLDRILTAHGFERVDCLKIDIEGAEPLLFDDLSKWMGRIGSVVIEMGGGLAPVADYDRLCDLFAASGFHCELFPSGRSLTIEEVKHLIRTDHLDYLFYRPQA